MDKAMNTNEQYEDCVFQEKLPLCILGLNENGIYEIRLTNKYRARCCVWIPCQFPDRKCEVKGG